MCCFCHPARASRFWQTAGALVSSGPIFWSIFFTWCVDSLHRENTKKRAKKKSFLLALLALRHANRVRYSSTPAPLPVPPALIAKSRLDLGAIDIDTPGAATWISTVASPLLACLSPEGRRETALLLRETALTLLALLQARPCSRQVYGQCSRQVCMTFAGFVDFSRDPRPRELPSRQGRQGSHCQRYQLSASPGSVLPLPVYCLV